MVDFPLDADDELPSGSVLFVPGLEQKLKKRMEKADLVGKNILKQSHSGSQVSDSPPFILIFTHVYSNLTPI